MKTYHNDGSPTFTRQLEIRSLIFRVVTSWILGNQIVFISFICIRVVTSCNNGFVQICTGRIQSI